MEIALLYHEPRPTDIFTEVRREVKSTVQLISTSVVISWGVAGDRVKLSLRSLQQLETLVLNSSCAKSVEIAPLSHEPRPTDIFTEVPREVKSYRYKRFTGLETDHVLSLATL